MNFINRVTFGAFKITFRNITSESEAIGTSVYGGKF